MRLRTVLLIAAALGVAGLVEYRLNVGPVQLRPQGVPVFYAAAPAFEAIDSDNAMFRLERYLGRHTVFVVFFDGSVGATTDPYLSMFLEHSEQLQRNQIKVVGVSAALPQENRRHLEQSGHQLDPTLITLVTDPPPEYLIHQMWGRFDPQPSLPLTGAFVVNRAGQVATDSGRIIPLADPQAAYQQLAGAP